MMRYTKGLGVPTEQADSIQPDKWWLRAEYLSLSDCYCVLQAHTTTILLVTHDARSSDTRVARPMEESVKCLRLRLLL